MGKMARHYRQNLVRCEANIAQNVPHCRIQNIHLANAIVDPHRIPVVCTSRYYYYVLPSEISNIHMLLSDEACEQYRMRRNSLSVVLEHTFGREACRAHLIL